ncbi:MAG: DUF2341 domain-containing protein [Halobacteriota archaeon]|nr:DUF2341 domain-containing protein [Halobacteriota archaeon]
MKLNSKVIVLGIVAFLLFSTTISIASALSNSGGGDWRYYKEIIIKEKSGVTLSDYQVLVEFASSNFPDKAKVDGSDLRFIKDEMELSYWIEDYDAEARNARIWVKVPEIPANRVVRIRMYYGNMKAGVVNDGDSTFDFFDDFEESDLDEGRWSSVTIGQTNASVSDGKLFLEGRCYNCGTNSGLVKIVTKDSFTPPMIVEWNSTFFHSYRDRGKSAWIGICDNSVGVGPESWGDNYALFQLQEVFNLMSDTPMRSTLSTGAKGKSTETEWIRDDYYRDSYNIYTVTVTDDLAKLSINYKDEALHTSNVPTIPMHGVLKVNSWQEDTYFHFLMRSYTDWFRIRKYAYPEPSITIGDESENINIETVSNLINTVSLKIDDEKSLGADVTEAEDRLEVAKNALNEGDYKYAHDLANDASELAKFANVSAASINDLKEFAKKYDQRTVIISGEIRDIETVYGQGYTFALDDGSGIISVAYEESLININDGDKITVSGTFRASSLTIEAENVMKSGFGGVPGFEAILTITGLLATAYFVRRRK